MTVTTRRLFLALALTTVPCLSAAYDDFLIEGVKYDASVATPESVLGHKLGEAPVRHHMLVSYITEIAEASPRMTVEVIGHTHERRPILFVVATSPQNHERIDQIRAAQVARTEGGVAADNMPAVTWLNYGVHGAEESGMDASLPVIYHLAAAQGETIERQLRESVVLLTAVFNPDGHNRRIAWRDQGWMNNSNRNDENRLHNFEWPSPRTNHYWFDLNRQWLLLTQPEPRAWVKKWHEWRPNLTVDYHEMGSHRSYYFHPGAPTRYLPLIPRAARDLTEQYAKYSADWLDTEGWLYFNEEGYDNFYIGKGSTFPLVNGGVGILYEAGGAAGGVIESDNSYVHSYRENIRKHFRTSIASVEAGVAMRTSLQQYQREFYETALVDAGKDNIKAYVFAAPEDNRRVQYFIDILTYHRIKVNDLARNIGVGEQSFAAGKAYLVDLNQHQYRLAKALFQTMTEFEDDTFYDVSTWTMPLSFNLMHAALSARQFRNDMLGEEITRANFGPGPEPDVASYGYIFGWSEFYAPRALYRLMDAGIKVRVITKQTRVQTTRGEVELDRGAIFVPFEHQPLSREAIFRVVAGAASKDGIVVHSLISGWTPSGPQLGSDSSIGLEKPEVLLLTGAGTSAYEAGEIWHLLDYRMGMKITLMNVDKLASADLDRYTHIILPAGFRAGNSPIQKEDLIESLSTWIKAGGTFIAQRNGAVWAQEKFLLPKDEEKKKETDKSIEEDQQIPRADYDDQPDMRAQRVIGGAIFGSDLDLSHPLAFGYVRRLLPSHKSGTHVLKTPKNPFAVVAEYLKDEPRLSGFASEENRKKIAGTPMLIAQRKGNGAVILYADDANFRAVWYGTSKLFMNAIFFSRAFVDPPRSFYPPPPKTPPQ